MNRGLVGAGVVVVVLAAFMVGRNYPMPTPSPAPGAVETPAAPKFGGPGAVPGGGLSVDAQGTVSIPAFQQPLSSYMSDKAKEIYTQQILNPLVFTTDQG